MTQVTIGELLRRHRLDAELTQKELAEKLGWHNTVISRVEQGRQQPTQEYVTKFVEVLNLPTEDSDEIWSVYRGEDASDSWPQRREDWGEAPDVSIFYGRYSDLGKLTQWVVTDRCRLVAILGMGGIGKTALVTKLARQVADQFNTIIWRSLRNAPPLSDILAEYIQFLSDQHEVHLPDDSEGRITRLIYYMDQQRCLLVLDNAESIMEVGKAGQYREGYADYGRLFQRIGEGVHQSCMLVTSREKPGEAGRLESGIAPVRSYALVGLEVIDGQQILASKGLIGSEPAKEALISHYSGNPLALTIVADMIREVYDQDIAEFLADEEIIFAEITDLLDEQFTRLSALEQSLMYWLAIEREAISKELLLEDLAKPVSRRELAVALRSLRRRSLIEGKGLEFTLQNVVMEYVTERLVEQFYEELRTSEMILFFSHTFVKLQAKIHVREIQIRLILEPVIRKLTSRYGQPKISNKLSQILLRIREKPHQNVAYAVGNLINLLSRLLEDLSDFDLSHLPIRNAYLQGNPLQDINLSYSDILGSVFTQDFGVILTTAFCSHPQKNELLAVGTTSGEVHLWTVPYITPLLTLKGHTDWVRSVAFDPSGSFLASSSNDKTVRIWDIETGKCQSVCFGHINRVESVAISPNGNLVASGGGEGSVYLWDSNTGQCLATWREHTNPVTVVAFNTNGTIVAGSNGQFTCLWDVCTGEIQKQIWSETDWGRSVAFSSNFEMLANGNYDQAIEVQDLRNNRCIEQITGNTRRTGAVAFCPNDRLLAVSNKDQTIQIWDLSDWKCVKTLNGHTGRIYSVNFNSDGSMLVSGGDDRILRLWDIESGRCIAVLQGYTNATWSSDFDTNGHTIATANDDYVVRIWETESGLLLKSLFGHTDKIWSVTFSPRGDKIASGGDRTVRIWDIQTGQCINKLAGHTRWVWSVAFNSNGSLLASCSDDMTVRVWDVHSGYCILTLREYNGWVRSVKFSPNEDLLATGSFDRNVCLVSLETTQNIKVLEGHTDFVSSIAFSPCGDLLASGSADQTIRLWEIKSGRCLKILKSKSGSIWDIDFSPDGSLLACGSSNGTIQVWDAHTRQHLKTIRGHSAAIWSLTFSPNKDHMITSSDDGTTKLWDLQTDECLKIYQPARPYERMNITGVTGLTDAQKASLKALGAIDENDP